MLTACTPTPQASGQLLGPQPRVKPSGAPASAGQREMLRAHNTRRAKHCAKPLRWSNELARTAKRWADELAGGRCALVHSDTPFGENLAAATTGAVTPEGFVELWYREVDDYRFARGRFSAKTGHFTQLAWRSSRTVGCAMSRCNGLDLWVCHYDPPGNVEGMFVDEVKPASCRK
jgi:pathogenesis-related protein 1